MKQQRQPELEMTLEGEFVSPPTTPLTTRILLWAVMIAVVAGALSAAAFALWLAFLILPVAIGAGLVAWGMLRYRVWRAQKAMAGQRGV